MSALYLGLKIAKILGIVLGVILLLALLLVIYVLFAPLRYRFDGSYYDVPDADAFACDLLHIAKLMASYHEGSLVVTFSLLGFCLIGGKKKEEAEEEEELPDEEAEGEEPPEETVEEEPEEPSPDEETPPPREELLEEPEEEFTDEDLDRLLREEEGEDVPSILEKAKKMASRMQSLYIDVTDERNKRAVLFMLLELWKLLQRFWPRVLYCDAAYSAGSCDQTGILTGVFAMTPFAYGRKVRLVPDFESEKAYGRGKLGLKGKIPLIYVAVSLLKIYRDKDCRRLIGKFR